MATGDLVTRSGFTLSAKVLAIEITVTSSSGTFVAGETITGSTGSGVVIYWDSTNEIISAANVSGTFSGTVTGGTSGATGTFSAQSASKDYNAAWVLVTRVRDTFTVNKSREETQVIDFDTAETDFADTIRGIRTGNASFTLGLAPGSAVFGMFEQADDWNEDIALQRIQVDRDAANTRTRYYVGGATQSNENDVAQDISTVDFQFTLSDVSVADPT